MYCNPARPKEECLGRACQQAKQGALHSADSLSVTWALQACNCVFKPPRFVSAETIVCVCVFLLQERWGQKRKWPRSFLHGFWCSGTMRVCADCGIFPHSWAVRRNQQRHVSYTPQMPDWQQQAAFRDLSPGTIASVSQLQFSWPCCCCYFNFIPKSISHLYKDLRKPHKWVHTAVHQFWQGTNTDDKV